MINNTFTKMMPCTPVGEKGPDCPEGWASVGYTQPGSCTLGNVPGDGPMDAWKMIGYNKVCKRPVPTSGDLAVDCCSNLYGISDSVECKTMGYKPYSWTCNNIMVQKCNDNIQTSPYKYEWNGMPYGQNIPVYDACSKTLEIKNKFSKKGCVDEFCVSYLKNAPPNNYFYNHDFVDYGRDYPKWSYTTPQFSGTWGYQPMRTPYTSYNNWAQKSRNNYARQFPGECTGPYPQNFTL